MRVCNQELASELEEFLDHEPYLNKWFAGQSDFLAMGWRYNRLVRSEWIEIIWGELKVDKLIFTSSPRLLVPPIKYTAHSANVFSHSLNIGFRPTNTQSARPRHEGCSHVNCLRRESNVQFLLITDSACAGATQPANQSENVELEARAHQINFLPPRHPSRSGSIKHISHSLRWPPQTPSAESSNRPTINNNYYILYIYKWLYSNYHCWLNAKARSKKWRPRSLGDQHPSCYIILYIHNSLCVWWRLIDAQKCILGTL